MSAGAAWRLDALDAVGGLAFASHRPAERADERLDASGPAVFFGAPGFQPVHLTSRSVGLSATRRTFQPGLFIGGAEVGFPDLDDAIEFVRRCYVGGGGGAGGGTRGTPPRPEGGPEGGSPPTVWDEVGGLEDSGKIAGPSILERLRSDAGRFAKDVAGLASEPGRSFPASWSTGSPRPGSPRAGSGMAGTSDGADILTRGAVRILDEMIRRTPRANQSPEDLLAWWGPLERFGETVLAMGLWHLMWREPYASHLGALLARADPGNLYWTHEYFGEFPYPRFENFGYVVGTRGRFDLGDALDDLQVVPVPSDVASSFGTPANGGDPTLLDLLSAMLSAPLSRDFVQPSDAAWELALFSAARIVLPASFARSGHRPALHAVSKAGGLDLRRLGVSRLAEDASRWFSRQLPRRGFGSDLERAICKSSTLVIA